MSIVFETYIHKTRVNAPIKLPINAIIKFLARSFPVIFLAIKDIAIRQFPVKSSAPAITIKTRAKVKATPPTNRIQAII